MWCIPLISISLEGYFAAGVEMGNKNVQGVGAATLPGDTKKFGTVQLEEMAGLGKM